MKHSPLPWRVRWEGETYSILDGNGQTIADDECYYPVAPSVDDMYFIVACVNKTGEGND